MILTTSCDKIMIITQIHYTTFKYTYLSVAEMFNCNFDDLDGS